MRILAVICSNGLGHYRRTTLVLDALAERLAPQDLDITIVCEAWQVEAMQNWEPSRRLTSRARLIFDVTQPGVEWSVDARGYEDGRLLQWERRLGQVAELETADLVLTDNLVGVLRYRPDAVLLGSFLWADVLTMAHPHSAEVSEFALREHELLTTNKPPIICSELLAMPALPEWCRTVPVGLMCETGPSDFEIGGSERRSVAVLGGATGAADLVLTEVANALDRRGFRVVASSAVAKRSSSQSINTFGFTPADFESLAAMVARPGVGAITDAVCSKIPLVLAYEGSNPELHFNAGVVEQWGLGIDLKSNPSPGAVVEAVSNVIDPAANAALRRNLARVNTDGIRQAVDWLVYRLGSERTIPSERT